MKLKLKYVVLVDCVFLSAVLSFLLQDTNRDLHRCPSNLPHTSRLFTYKQFCIEFVIGDQKYWSDARDYCHNRGGYLVTIPDSSTNSFLMRALNWLQYDSDGALWVGLNDRDHENDWQWDEGHALHAFKFWADGEPSTFFHAAQDCVVMRYSDHGHWEDQACGLWPYHYDFICQYHMLPQTKTTTASTTTTTTMPTTTTTSRHSPTTITSTAQSSTEHTVTTVACDSVDCQNSCPGGYSGIYVGSDGCITCKCN